MFDRFRKAREFAEQHEKAFADAQARGEPSLARQALAVAINPANGTVWNGGRLVAPCALLLELVSEGRLGVSGTGAKARVEIIDPSPLGDEDLDEALVTIGTGIESTKVTSLLGVLPQTKAVLQRMVLAGQLAEDERKRLGLFTVRRYFPTPLSRRDELAGRVRAALTSDSPPDQRTIMLVGSLVGVHPKVCVGRGEVNEAYRRLPEVRALLGEGERAIVSAARETQAKANSN